MQIKTLFISVILLNIFTIHRVMTQNEQLNKQFYETHWQHFDHIPFGEKLTNLIQTYSPTPGAALDIGCGPGNLALFLHQQEWDVTCVDPVPAMIYACKNKGLTNVHQQTIQTFETEKHYNLIAAICSLLHVPIAEHEEQIKRIEQWLAPGGIFYVSMISGEQGEREMDHRKTGMMRDFSIIDHDAFKALLSTFFDVKEDAMQSSSHGVTYSLFVARKKIYADSSLT